MMYRVLPAEPDTRALAELIARMPGGDYVKDAWLDEDKVLVGLSMHAFNPTRTLQAVLEAYPARKAIGYVDGDGGLVLHVPVTVAKMLDFLPLTNHPEEDTITVEVIDLSAEDVDGELAWELTAKLWSLEGWFGNELAAAYERFEYLEAEAENAGVDPRRLAETASVLWGDKRYDGFTEAVELALAALA